MFSTNTGIWKATNEGILGVTLSKSKAIRCESAGSIAPKAESKAFLCFVQDCRTSKVDIAARY